MRNSEPILSALTPPAQGWITGRNTARHTVLVICFLAGAGRLQHPQPSAQLTIGLIALSSPTSPADITAAPAVTTPAASVARFSIWPLPTIAAEVHAELVETVTVTRMGGLYGP